MTRRHGRLPDRPGGAGRRVRLADRPFALAAPARLLAAPASASTAPTCRSRCAPEPARAGDARPAGSGLSRRQHHPAAQGAGARARRRVDAGRARIGAVNTVVVEQDGRCSATTPTATASWQPRAQAGLAGGGGPAVVLGAGGAARAVVVALLEAGVPELRLVNRTPARAEELAASSGGAEWRVLTVLPSSAAALKVGMLVNTTNLGMAGQTPLELALDAAAARQRGQRHRLHAAGDRAAGGGAGARPPRGRRARHAAAPGAARLSRLVRRRARGDERLRATVLGAGSADDVRARPHRLHRHGQVDRGAGLPPPRRAGVRCRCRGARAAGAGRRRGGARSTRPFPGCLDAPAASTARRSADRCSTIRRRWTGSRHRASRWCARRSGASSRAAARAGRRAGGARRPAAATRPAASGGSMR